MRKKVLWFFFFLEITLAQQKLRLAVAGDLMCHDNQLNKAYQEETKDYIFDPFFQLAKEWISKADLAIANLETTLPGENFKGYPLFGSPDSFAQAIKNAGFDILVTANNHSLDRGSSGLIRTLDVLRDLGFYYTGTYRNNKEREENPFLFLKVNNINLAILNYTFSTNGISPPPEIQINYPLKYTQIQEDIKKAKEKNADFIMVYFHFGEEYERWPNTEQKKWAHFAIEKGAHIVLGSHPHVIQPIESFFEKDSFGEERQRFIAYSLGNFISGQTKPHTEIGVLLYFDLVKEENKFLIKEIQPKFFYTFKLNKAFSLEPLPELFQKEYFKILPKNKQREIKNYYYANLSHIYSFMKNNGLNIEKKSLEEATKP